MKTCDICGKGSIPGCSIVRRGLAKRKGGIGLHTTRVNKRKFLPNLHKVRVFENGRVVRKTLCTSCIKSGNIQKRAA